MDQRIEQHADILVRHSMDASRGDEVAIVANEGVQDLITSICRRLGDRGITPILLRGGNFVFGSDESLKTYLSASNEIRHPRTLTEMLADVDEILHIRSHENPYELARLSESTVAAHRGAYGEILNDVLLEGSYTLTHVPTPGGAQLAGMSSAEFESFVWDATLLDWEAQRREQIPLAETLTDGETIRVENDAGTDVEFSVAGMRAVNSHGRINLPGGEVYTAPVRDSLDGRIRFDIPLMLDGREFCDTTVEFRDGEIVDIETPQNAALLRQLLELDDGSGRIGEFGIGTNEHIDRPSRIMALDEKMAGTIHFAFGSAYEACVGDTNVRNRSAVHIDMGVDMRGTSRVSVDGTPIQKDGELVVE